MTLLLLLKLRLKKWEEVFNRIKGVDLMLDLVESYSDVVRNAREFLDSVDDEGLVNKLSMFRHWYYVEEIDAFAPSKFIGYKDITIEDYRIGTSVDQGYMDGRDTVKQLKEWFQPIDNENYEIYYKRLEEFLSQYDKKPNKMLQLYYKR